VKLRTTLTVSFYKKFQFKLEFSLFLFYTELQADFDQEVATRIDEEKNIMLTLDDTKYELHKKIDNERTDKSLSLGNFKDSTHSQLKRQHKYVEEFQVEAMKEFARLRQTLEHEMSERFEN
jgi:hypothetical protein